jgi:hypothetical protein
MKIKNKILVLLVIIIMIATQVGFASTRGHTAQYENSDRLTSEQMKNAVIVSDGSFASRSTEEGPFYRLANCDETNSDAPCYFTITGSSSRLKSNIPGDDLLSTNATISCGVNIYSFIGILAAKLKQNVNVTFWGTFGRTPVTLNWGDLQGTATYLPYYSWNSLTGPNPNPAWGVYVSSSGTAFTTAGGLLIYQPPPPLPGVQNYVSTRLTINSTGWSCT